MFPTEFPRNKKFPPMSMRAAFAPQSALVHSGLRMHALNPALAPESLTDWGTSAWTSLADEHAWLAPLFRAAETGDDIAIRDWVDSHHAECAPSDLEHLTRELTEALWSGAVIDREKLADSVQCAWEAAVTVYDLQVAEQRDDAELERIAVSVVALEETAESYYDAGHDALARGLRDLIHTRWGLDHRTVAALAKALRPSEVAA